MHAQMFMSEYMYPCTHMHTHAHAHTYIHTHTHIAEGKKFGDALRATMASKRTLRDIVTNCSDPIVFTFNNNNNNDVGTPFDMVILSEDMGYGGQRILSYALDYMQDGMYVCVCMYVCMYASL